MWGPITVQFDTTGYFPVKLTVITDGTQCTYSDSIKIHSVIAPEMRIGSKTDVCIGDTVEVALSSITPGITNYVWNFGDATIISATDAVNAGPYKVMWVNSGLHNITAYGMVSELCVSKLTYDTINVHELPKAIMDKSGLPNAAVCMGDSLHFSAMNFVPENMYTWAPDHFFRNLNKPEIYGRIEAPGYVTLTVTDPFGCSAIDRVMVDAKACCNVAFPTMFTPNGDGKNDVFRPITIGHHAVHEFRVVNRWGQTVFETANEQEGWNGNFNGVPQDLGVYFYYIKYDCNGKTIEDKGDVTLVR